MFEFIRTHQRLMQFVLLLFIIPSFALVGIQSYSKFNDSDNAVAKVGRQSISQQEWDAAQRKQMDRFRQMFGAQFDPKMFDTPAAKKGVLDNLIAQRALAAEAARSHLAVSDQSLQQTILAIPGLIGVDGKFDSERYKSLLAAQGMTPAMFEAGLRQDLALQQLNGAVQSSAFAPRTVANRLSDINDQERDVQQLLFRAADYASQVKVTDDMLKSYYEKNSPAFEIPEQAKAEYVVLDSAALARQITVSDSDVKAYYEQNAPQYTVDEQRRASHILISVKKDASDADKAAAKAKAESLLAQVRKSPADFGKLAKANSQDVGSAERGGDLGFFGKGMMVKPFEAVAFKLREGEISDLVQSDFGYHIIQLTGLKPAMVKPLGEVKDEIGATIKKQLATKRYAELAEQFTNTVYEQADSLQPVADKLKLTVETATGLTRKPNPSLAPTVAYNNEKFLRVLFSDDVIKNKRNTEAVEVAPNTLIAGRIVEYKPVSKRPFAEVQAAIRERVTQIEAAKLAKKAGDDKLAALQAKDDVTGFGEKIVVSRAKAAGLDNAALTAVMKADTSKLPSYVGVELPAQAYALYRIGKVSQPAAPDSARRQAEQQQVANALAQQEMLTYIEVLKQKAKVTLLKPAPAIGAAGDAQDKSDSAPR